MTRGPLVRAEEFVREVDQLEPRWSGVWSLERYLRVFDENGSLRPVYRVVFPERYAYHNATRHGMECDVALEEKETSQFERCDHLLADWRGGSADPETATLFERPPMELAEFIRESSRDERVGWSDWERVVTQHEGRPLSMPFAFSFYGEWQKLRLWTLLEAHTFRALIDPRLLGPGDVFDPTWDRDTRGRLMAWTVGNPRMLRLVDLVEADDWLHLVYLLREVIHWGELRVQEPRLARWAQGEAMTIEDRATAETL